MTFFYVNQSQLKNYITIYFNYLQLSTYYNNFLDGF